MIVWINGAFGAGKTATAQELIDLIPNSTLYDPELIGAGLRRMLPPKRLAEVSDCQDLPIWRRLVVDTAAAMLAELGGVLVVPMTLPRQEYRDEIFGGLAARRIPVCQVLLRSEESILRGSVPSAGRPGDAGPVPPADGPRPPEGPCPAEGAHLAGGAHPTDGPRPAGGAHPPAGALAVPAPRTVPGEEPAASGALTVPASRTVPGSPAAAGARPLAEPSADPAGEEWADDRIRPLPAAPEWIADDAFVIDTAGLDPRRTARRIADALRTGEAAVCAIVQTPEPTAETLAAGVLLFDEEDRVLLVDPTYKPGWEFPGGVVERGEAPARAGIREVAEELGIELDRVPRLLVADWEPPLPPGYGGLRLLFDGGRLTGDTAARILLPGAELRDWRFVAEQEAQRLLPPLRYERLRWALRARERGTVLYLESGVPY
ncbi:NUDIX domain-containing protein [Streptomyces sp. NPDC014894]|uniref:NUDIX domain-containing protein n=1 Tax=Streptomyces sp. NPDC014894 TaxID=3364931 RepID=UPI0036F9CF29